MLRCKIGINVSSAAFTVKCKLHLIQDVLKNTRKRRKTKVLFLNNTTRGQIFLDSASEKVHIVV